MSLSCGDGKIDAGEECDDGADRNKDIHGSRCRSDCSRARCADRIRDPAEACDDGNLLNGDGCSDLCQREAGAAPNIIAFPGGNFGVAGISAQYPFPGIATPQPLPWQLPLASLQPLTTSRAPVGDTGPAAVAVIAAGAAAGWSVVRRRIRRSDASRP